MDVAGILGGIVIVLFCRLYIHKICFLLFWLLKRPAENQGIWALLLRERWIKEARGPPKWLVLSSRFICLLCGTTITHNFHNLITTHVLHYYLLYSCHSNPINIPPISYYHNLGWYGPNSQALFWLPGQTSLAALGLSTMAGAGSSRAMGIRNGNVLDISWWLMSYQSYPSNDFLGNCIFFLDLFQSFNMFQPKTLWLIMGTQQEFSRTGPPEINVPVCILMHQQNKGIISIVDYCSNNFKSDLFVDFAAIHSSLYLHHLSILSPLYPCYIPFFHVHTMSP